MENKIRAISHYIHDLLNKPHEHIFTGCDSYATLAIQYMFYPEDSPHVAMVSTYLMIFKVLKPIVSMSDEGIELSAIAGGVSIKDLIQIVDQKNYASELQEKSLYILKQSLN